LERGRENDVGSDSDDPSPRASAPLPGPGRHQAPDSRHFAPRREVLVQVSKKASAPKGPGFSTYISIPGRYLVLMQPSTCGRSRK